MLEHAGLRVLEEQAYDLRFGDDCNAWILDFLCSDAGGGSFDIAALKDRLQEVLEVTLAGEVEDDGFNMLVTRAGLDWRQANLFRALARYLRQTEITYSHEYLCATLVNHPAIVADLARLFDTLLDPDYRGDREVERRRLAEAVDKALEAVSSLDQDRIIRLFLNLVCSILRTNYFCQDKDGRRPPALSFKIDSKALDELPEPRPMVEIFVYSPRVEGIHLRGGRIARGGLRWSDRREDFRTEVLGLMKAQMVKNAIIVPVGAKGGFVLKRPPVGGDREARQAEAIACYKVFVAALLDLTDNIKAGKVVPPKGMVRRDIDDPYMVVAADKGTASFSDIANAISQEKGFWLGDAFASGGSVGYDHKEMGITARGAWVNVQRHFREMGVDVQKDTITVIGIGDMSGDVFGNGLLRSKAVKLIAVFDHRDIFIDPDPDPEKSYKERQRLYDLPRSSWQDYAKGLISKGGGVFSRQLKAITLTPEMQAVLGCKAEHLTPAELIKALLQAQADLLWIGGIGTYVKASTESHVQVGDRSNDALRIDARDLRVKVVGEGGNLGFTQLGRIEYARKGGHLNTDAVDNAAGVNTSDHEVNIKIFLNHLLADGKMTAKARKTLLASMTEDVAAAVLEDNYQQSQTLSVLEAQGTQLVEYQKRLMRAMERRGRLNRQVEYLPSDEALAELAKEDKALTRPELAVIVAYAKMVLFDDILDSDIAALPSMEDMLHRYVPDRLDKAWGKALEKHQLRDEIIATELANEIVNYAGPTFLARVEEESGFSQEEAIRAYVVSRTIYNLRDLWARIEALDHKVPATIQYLMFLDTIELLRRNTQRLLTTCQGRIDVARLTDIYRGGLATLAADPEALLSEFELQAYREKRDMYKEQGVPDDLARDVAALDPLVAACDIIDVAGHSKLSVEATASCYFRLGSLIGLDWLRSAAEDFQVSDYWESLAINAMIDDMLLQQKHLAIAALKSADKSSLPEAAAEWVRRNKAGVERMHQLLADFRTSGSVDVSKLGYATRFIRQLTPRRN
jgi:glutamate dehydrogenase